MSQLTLGVKKKTKKELEKTSLKEIQDRIRKLEKQLEKKKGKS